VRHFLQLGWLHGALTRIVYKACGPKEDADLEWRRDRWISKFCGRASRIKRSNRRP
jgi:hypothetical protein